MTMPYERTRAVLQTEEFLKELSRNTDIPEEIKIEAFRLLRHFPDAGNLKYTAYYCPDHWSDPDLAQG